MTFITPLISMLWCRRCERDIEQFRENLEEILSSLSEFKKSIHEF